MAFTVGVACCFKVLKQKSKELTQLEYWNPALDNSVAHVISSGTVS
jgi:hypothetical protein